MKAIVLTCDKYHKITNHMITTYQDLWPSNKLKFVIPYNEKQPSGKIFNFWIGHTNFDITHNVKETIEAVDGIEILDVFTRYRFRIAIGKSFTDREVMNNIYKGLSNKFSKVNMDHLQDIHSYGLNVKNREIFLHNFLGSNDEANPGVEFRMASVFLKNIKILEHISHDPITIYMNSVGGEWADGMLIYDAIQLSKCYVTTVVYAQAESMSSIILQAADERVLSPNSYFMPHYGSTDAGGEYLSVQNWVKFLV